MHPETSADFFPLLAGALVDDQALPIFQRILASKPPWQDRFLVTASANPEAVVNVAKLRREVIVENENLDSALIARLADAEEFGAAQQHYEFLEKRFPRDISMALRSQYPPLDWKFSDTREKRSQLSRDGNAIEIFVRPGAGGVIMDRIVAVKDGQVDVSIAYDFGQSAQIANIRLQANCPGSSSLLIVQSFEEAKGTMRLQVPASECDFMRLALYARVPSGRPALRGSISNFTVK